jgi:hypothetical protein
MTSATIAPSAILVIENEKGRQALLDRAEAGLSSEECLVRVVDVIGLRRAVRTTPTHPNAVLVARELPLIVRGGLTSLVSYYRVPVEGLDAREEHTVNGEHSHTYDVILHVARLGKKETVPPVPA